jgi:hypothetical protein
MGQFIKQITWARWRTYDPYDSQYYTVYTVAVPKPSYEYPGACMMMWVTNTKGKVMARYASLQALRQVYVIPIEYEGRLEEGYRQAEAEALKVQTRLRAMIKIDNLQPGARVIRTDTGEVVAEAERIIKEAQG